MSIILRTESTISCTRYSYRLDSKIPYWRCNGIMSCKPGSYQHCTWEREISKTRLMKKNGQYQGFETAQSVLDTLLLWNSITIRNSNHVRSESATWTIFQSSNRLSSSVPNSCALCSWTSGRSSAMYVTTSLVSTTRAAVPYKCSISDLFSYTSDSVSLNSRKVWQCSPFMLTAKCKRKNVCHARCNS